MLCDIVFASPNFGWVLENLCNDVEMSSANGRGLDARSVQLKWNAVPLKRWISFLIVHYGDEWNARWNIFAI